MWMICCDKNVADMMKESMQIVDSVQERGHQL